TLSLLVFAYDAGILLVFVFDGLLARRTFRNLRVTRERPARLSVGIDNEVVLLLENRGGRAVRLLARDEPPPGFRAEPALLETTLPPHTWVRVPYQLLPTDR